MYSKKKNLLNLEFRQYGTSRVSVIQFLCGVTLFANLFNGAKVRRNKLFLSPILERSEISNLVKVPALVREN